MLGFWLLELYSVQKTWENFKVKKILYYYVIVVSHQNLQEKYPIMNHKSKGVQENQYENDRGNNEALIF